jgi:hypothetical protein
VLAKPRDRLTSGAHSLSGFRAVVSQSVRKRIPRSTPACSCVSRNTQGPNNVLSPSFAFSFFPATLLHSPIRFFLYFSIGLAAECATLLRFAFTCTRLLFTSLSFAFVAPTPRHPFRNETSSRAFPNIPDASNKSLLLRVANGPMASPTIPAKLSNNFLSR